MPTTMSAAALTEAEREVLSGVRDYTQHIDEAGLYVLLSKVRLMDLNLLVTEAVVVRRADLLRHPEAYRGRLVKLEARYAESVAFEPMNRRRYADAAYSTLGWERDSLEAVSLITVDDPGRPARGADVVLAGYFLKIRRDERREEDPNATEAVVEVPVLVGRAVKVRPREPLRFDMTGFSAAALVVGIVLLALLWFVLRSKIRAGAFGRRVDRTMGELKEVSLDPRAPENRPIDLAALERGEGPGDDGSSPSTTTEAMGGVRACPLCGAGNRQAAQFCDQCGGALNDRA
ncbi:MAG: zinc ribbon domain-containing protein [Phycisphaerae bacterium]|nr:zinc ribbon domain-containing protein [Phycisphaerae bacterium]